MFDIGSPSSPTPSPAPAAVDAPTPTPPVERPRPTAVPTVPGLPPVAEEVLVVALNLACLYAHMKSGNVDVMSMLRDVNTPDAAALTVFKGVSELAARFMARRASDSSMS